MVNNKIDRYLIVKMRVKVKNKTIYLWRRSIIQAQVMEN